MLVELILSMSEGSMLEDWTRERSMGDGRPLSRLFGESFFLWPSAGYSNIYWGFFLLNTRKREVGIG